MADHLVQLHMADCLVLHRAAEGFLSVFSRSVQYTHTHAEKSTIWDFEGSIRKADDAGNPILPSHHSAMGDEATDLCDKASNERKIRRPAHTSIVHHQHIASLKQKDNQQVSMLSLLLPPSPSLLPHLSLNSPPPLSTLPYLPPLPPSSQSPSLHTFPSPFSPFPFSLLYFFSPPSSFSPSLPLPLTFHAWFLFMASRAIEVQVDLTLQDPVEVQSAGWLSSVQEGYTYHEHWQPVLHRYGTRFVYLSLSHSHTLS